jgi:hypothetical protein
MHAVGSEIFRCSGILCENEFFVRGWRSRLRTVFCSEVNVPAKLNYKDARVSLCELSGTGTTSKRYDVESGKSIG